MRQSGGPAVVGVDSSATPAVTGREGGGHVAIWFVVIVMVAQAVALFLPDVLRPDLYNDDAQQHIWWTYRFADPSLFPNDFIAQLYSQPTIAPVGLQAIYRLFVPWIDAQVLSELLPFGLAIATSVLAWLIGRRAAGGNRAGGVVACVFAGWVLYLYLIGGFARAFAQPILMLGMWALLARRNRWLGLTFVLAALFYPQTVVNLGLLAVVVLGVRALRERRVPSDWAWLVGLGLVAAAIMVAVYARPLPAGIGPAVTEAEARAMPEFGPGGRSKFFTDDPVAYYIEGARSGFGIPRHLFALLIGLIGLGAWRFRGALPFEAWALAGTSVAAFALAHATLFALYVPNRYVVYTIALFVMMCFAAWLPPALAALRLERFFDRREIRVGLAVLACGASVWMSAHRMEKLLGRPVARDLEAAYAYLRTLPNDTLIAAHPIDAEPVALRTRRSVLAWRETSDAFFLGYYRKVADRIKGELAACFATDWAEVDALHERFGASVFLVNRDRYRTPESSSYIPPFRDAALEQIARGRREGFVLDHPPAERVLFSQGNYLIVELRPAK